MSSTKLIWHDVDLSTRPPGLWEVVTKVIVISGMSCETKPLEAADSSLPTLEISSTGLRLKNPNSMLYFIGKQAGLYGESLEEEVRIAEILGIITDFYTRFESIQQLLEGPEKLEAAKRQKVWNRSHFNNLEKLILSNQDTKGHAVGFKTTVADLAIENCFNQKVLGFSAVSGLENIREIVAKHQTGA